MREKYIPAFLEEVVGDRFGRYSKYIIQDRAIPDVRDGLKPVQRRILYAMYESGNTPNNPYRKSAKTVGDVMGNYHPHGDASIYDGMVRMAQPWKMSHCLIDGHGNWGSLDDDPPAAMRYTEARLPLISVELLKDIEKNTVDFKDNFDNTAREPVVLPARYPNLLVNGVSGISSGFATEIPPHSLRESITACIALLDHADLSLESLMEIIPGPDFPTGGIIMGTEGISQAYETGKGRIQIRAKTAIESMRAGREQIVITELPYQVVKAKLVNNFEQIRLEKRIDGITEVRDESGRDGLRIVIELKKDADSQSILNYLLKKTDLQVSYNFNMVAIVNKAPKQLGLRGILEAYIAHQKEVVTKRTTHELEKAQDRAHVLAGLKIALLNLDEVIQIIKGSNNKSDAHHNLQARFSFTDRQAEAILMLQLYRLTNLEITSIEQELEELQKKIALYESILGSEKKLAQVIRKELKEIQEKFGIDRRSEIQEESGDLTVNLETLVSVEDVFVTITHDTYIKRTSMLSYTRSGGEKETSGTKEGDFTKDIFELNTLDQLLLLTEKGYYSCLPVHQIPEFKWKDAGTALVNLVPHLKDDRLVAMIPVKKFDEADATLTFVTAKGQVKRSKLIDYHTTRSTAVVACKVQKDDKIVDVFLSDGQQDLLLITKQGMSIRFKEEEVSVMGRAAGGVRGIQLKEDDEVLSAIQLPNDEGEILVLSEFGFAKRTLVVDYLLQNRGGKGVQTFEFQAKKNGQFLVNAFLCLLPYTIISVTKEDAIHEIWTESVPIQDRKAKGKKVIKLEKEEYIAKALKKV